MKTLLQIILLVFLSSSLSFGQVGFDNDSPDPSAVLDLSATDKGLLIPRMTTQEREAIASPANSLLVFDTSVNNYFYYINNQWVPLNQWSSSATNDDVYLESGNVGIGTTTPERPLEVYSETSVAPIRMTSNRSGGADSYLEFKNKVSSQPNTAIGLGYWNSMEGQFVIKLGDGEATPQEKFRINANGNVGIGKDTPFFKLDVNGPVNTSALFINGTEFSAADLHPVSNGSAAKTATGDWNDYVNTGFCMGQNLLNRPPHVSGGHSWHYVTVIRHNHLHVVQNATDFSNVASWKRVLLNGTWQPWKRTVIAGEDHEFEHLTIKGNSTSHINFYEPNSSTNSGYIGRASTAISDIYLASHLGNIKLRPKSGYHIILENGGTIQNSDKRLKKDIVNLNNSLEKVKALQGVNYKLIDDEREKTQTGFVADDVLEVAPELVFVPENEDEMKGVNYTAIIPILVEAIKEQQTQIEILKAEIKELKN